VTLHTLLATVATCFALTAVSSPGAVPRTPWARPRSAAGDAALAPAAAWRSPGGAARYCPPCGAYKPDGAHHCRQSGRCVPGWDHHCPLVASAVGAGNRKFFALALVYAAVGAAGVVAAAAPTVARRVWAEAAAVEAALAAAARPTRVGVGRGAGVAARAAAAAARRAAVAAAAVGLARMVALVGVWGGLAAAAVGVSLLASMQVWMAGRGLTTVDLHAGGGAGGGGGGRPSGARVWGPPRAVGGVPVRLGMARPDACERRGRGQAGV